MRKEITYKLPYRQDGDKFEKEIHIDFISQYVLNEYSKIVDLAQKAERANDRISDLNSLIAAEKMKKEEGYEERIEKFSNELKEQIDIILDFNDNGYFKKRFDILNRMLVDNGYKNDELLMDQKFWDECVDPLDLILFMTKAIYKDIDPANKKKAV